MLTRQGWVTAVLAGVLIVGGRVLGALELFVLGGVGAALVLVAALLTGLTRLSLEVDRELHPRRLHAGATSRVHLQVRNVGKRRSPAVSMADAHSGGRGAVVSLAPLDPGQVARLTYDLPTSRRGILSVGPLRVSVGDPFGLTRLVLDAHDATELTVYPPVEALPPLGRSRRGDPPGAAVDPDALGRSGEEFYALRPYVIGDDLRRVHWASSARHEDLMVRQDTSPLQHRLTILADLRAEADTDRLDAVVSAAASLVARCALDQEPVRLVTSAGADSGMGTSRHHIRSLLEHLAVAGPSSQEHWQTILARLTRSGDGGTLVLLAAAPEESTGDLALGGRYDRTIVVTPGDEPFAVLWARARVPAASR